MTEPSGPASFSAPPRTAGNGLAARMLLGSVRSQIGWLVVAFGSIFFWGFAWHADISGWRFQARATGQTQGQSLNCKQTRYSEGGSRSRRGTPIYENRYRYEVAFHQYEAFSFATGTCLTGGPVAVEYLLEHPKVSRIAGMRRQVFGPWALIIALMPGVGVIMIVTGALRGSMQLHLLRDGLTTTGRVVEKVRTNVQTNGRSVYRITFEFTAQSGQTARVSTRTNSPSQFDNKAFASVLYDPVDPRRAALLADLPGKVAADQAGQPISRTSLAFLFLPALAVIGNGLYVLSILKASSN